MFPPERCTAVLCKTISYETYAVLTAGASLLTKTCYHCLLSVHRKPRNLLLTGEPSGRAAVAQVLDSVSWEAFGLVMGCLEQSVTTSSRPVGNGSSSSEKKVTVTATATAAAEAEEDSPRPPLVEEVAALSEKLALEMAEIFSPKELHIMALEHLHAYSEERQGCLLNTFVSSCVPCLFLFPSFRWCQLWAA